MHVAKAPCPRELRADALVALEPGLAVGVFTADCVPILLAHREGRGVAAVHAGWRGSGAQVARIAARALAESLSCETAELIAAIGPHVGPCCYEVDLPVLRAIEEPVVFAPGRPGHAQLDLGLLNQLQLLRAGLPVDAITRVGGCTCCDSTRYLSYRRDGAGGRMLHFVRMRA